MIKIDADSKINHLMEAGLTGYEARAYLTMLRMKRAKVLALSRESGIPRNKLYHVLDELQRMGLVEVVNPEPLEYGARPLAPYIEAKVGRLTQLLKSLSVTDLVQEH